MREIHVRFRLDPDAGMTHIACDADSRSELVVPLIADGEVFGVLDLDSPVPGRFSADDQAAIERIAAIYVESID